MLQQRLVAIQVVAVPLVVFAIAWAIVDRSASMRASGNPLLPIAALATLQTAIMLFALRLRFSLATFGIPVGTRAAVLIALQSLFYFFVPFSAGTELCRWVKIRAASPGASHLAVIASVSFDRLTAVAACVAISLLCLLVVELKGVTIDLSPVKSIAPWSLALLGLGIVVTATVIAQRCGWAGHLYKIILLGGRRLFWGTLAATTISFCVQTLTVISLWLLARWLHIDLGLAGIALGATGGALAQVLPLSLAGAGPAEIGAALLFNAAGAPPDQAVLLASLLYLFKLLAAIQGGILEWPPLARRIAGLSESAPVSLPLP